jgi:hypothetical protein
MSARSRALLYITLIFFSGVIAGALGMNLLERYYWVPPHPAAAANWEDADRQAYVELFKRQLNLTDDQTRRLETILDETMKQYHDLHFFTHHIRDDGLTRVRAMLTDEQRKRFDELTRKMEPPSNPPKGKK